MENNMSTTSDRWKRGKSIVLPRRAPPVPVVSWAAMVVALVLVAMQLPAGSLGNSLSVIGVNCTVREPLYNITFDLTALDSELAHHVLSDVNDKFEFDVCDQLKKPCHGKTGGAACLRKAGGAELLLGTHSTLQLTDGRLHFNFSGGEPCRDGKSYSLDIILMCTYSASAELMDVVPYSSDQCGYFMFWTTRHACAPLPDRLKTNECSVKDSTGHVFNLLPLSKVNNHVPDRSGSHFFVTACKPVHYGHMTMCPPGSSVCFVNKTEEDYTKKYHDYGQTDANPTIEGDKLVMNFESSEGKCQDSKVIFECDLTATEETPEYVGKEDCTHLFSWRTSLACKKQEFCTVIDPASGTKFNMSLLAGKKYTVTEGNMTYEFEICKSLNSSCPGQSGSCQLTQNNAQAVSLGTINDQLLYNITGAPYLLYNSGAICNPTSQQKWSTKIEFICETDKGSQTPPPKVVENTNCEVIIQLETELACTREISCTAMNLSNDREIDLRPLISAEHNYEALVNSSLASAGNKEKKFFLNVCRPLLSTFGLGCPGGSAVCMAEQGPSDKTPTNELSLGYPDVSLIVVKDRAQLKYLRGSVCPQDNATKLSTEIEFYCEPKAGLGQPILQEVLHDCHYRFEWPTNVICPRFLADFRQKNCEVMNSETSASVELRKIFKNGELLVAPSKGSVAQELKEGKIQLCDKNLTTLVAYKERAMKVLFSVADASCEGTAGKINVNLRVACGIESYDVNEQSPCHLLLTQVSPHVCALVGAPVPDGPSIGTTTTGPAISSSTEKLAPVNGKTTLAPMTPVTEAAESKGSSGGGAVGITLAVLTLVSLAGAGGFLLLRNPERREYLRSLFRGRNVLVQYSRVRTNEEASLLMQPSGTLSDSDDELLI